MIFTLLFWNTKDEEQKQVVGKVGLQESQLQSWLQTAVQQTPETYGAVALVDVPGQADWQGAVGWQKMSEKLVMNTDSMFVFSGLAQPMLATITLQLAEEGCFSLDDQVNQYLQPELLCLLTERHRQELSFRHLLNYTSGIFDSLGTKEFPHYTASSNVLSQVKATLQHGVSYSAPGRSFHYSEVNYLLLSILLEEITGQETHQLLEQRIFEPLGMRRSMQSSATDLVSTASDLRRYIHAFASGSLLRNKTRLREMLNGAEEGYGLGWRIFNTASTGSMIWGHTGAGSGCHSNLLYFEEYDAIIVYAANTYAKAHNTTPTFMAKIVNALKERGQ